MPWVIDGLQIVNSGMQYNCECCKDSTVGFISSQLVNAILRGLMHIILTFNVPKTNCNVYWNAWCKETVTLIAISALLRWQQTLIYLLKYCKWFLI